MDNDAKKDPGDYDIVGGNEGGRVEKKIVASIHIILSLAVFAPAHQHAHMTNLKSVHIIWFEDSLQTFRHYWALFSCCWTCQLLHKPTNLCSAPAAAKPDPPLHLLPAQYCVHLCTQKVTGGHAPRVNLAVLQKKAKAKAASNKPSPKIPANKNSGWVRDVNM
ncbi:hypothetical protein EDC04DRAFT_2608627 [Pisolithus marmoratus]|nr:hypothetical protein EDC04DRAFT_2608627 [Pisolithus marmoratus]